MAPTTTAQEGGGGVGSVSRTGCMRCGKEGHWARDCPENMMKADAAGDERDAGVRDVERTKKEERGGDEEAPVAKKRRIRRVRVNDEMMTSAVGLPWVYTNLPEAFKRQYKGRGHEVRYV